MRTLLIGLGNPILTDDAVGIRLASDLLRRLGDVAGLDAIPDCSEGGLNLLDLVAGYDRLILIDSLRTAAPQPGRWQRFTGSRLSPTWNLAGVHDANVATALELGRRLGLRVPAVEEVHILAVEVAAGDLFGDELTPCLAAAYPRLLDEIAEEVRALVVRPHAPAPVG